MEGTHCSKRIWQVYDAPTGAFTSFTQTLKSLIVSAARLAGLDVNSGSLSVVGVGCNRSASMAAGHES